MIGACVRVWPVMANYLTARTFFKAALAVSLTVAQSDGVRPKKGLGGITAL